MKKFVIHFSNYCLKEKNTIVTYYILIVQRRCGDASFLLNSSTPLIRPLPQIHLSYQATPTNPPLLSGQTSNSPRYWVVKY